MPLTRSSSNCNFKLNPKILSLASALLLLSTATRPTGAATTSSLASQTTQSDECPDHPNLTPEYWESNKFDEYLRNYPNGNSLTLPEYVKQLPLRTPFKCGVGAHCRVPRICHPLRGPDWYILDATSQWNYYVNSLVGALHASSKLAKALVPELLADFIPDYSPTTTRFALTEVDLIRILLATIDEGGTQTNSTATPQLPEWQVAIAPIISDYPQSLVPANNADHKPYKSVLDPQPSDNHKVISGKHLRFKRQLLPQNTGSDMPIIVFNSTQPVEQNLALLSTEFHHMLTDSITHKINSPISLDEGMYFSLKGGRFLVENVEPAGLDSNAKDIASLIGISGLLKAQNAMVLVRKSSCHQHRDDYQHKKDSLSFCASDGTLIEIVKVAGDTVDKKIHNGHLVKEKYHFGTSFLASEAWRCSQAGQDQSAAENSAEHKFDLCTFDIPVCDLTEREYAGFSAEGESFAQLCREAGVQV